MKDKDLDELNQIILKIMLIMPKRRTKKREEKIIKKMEIKKKI